MVVELVLNSLLTVLKLIAGLLSKSNSGCPCATCLFNADSVWNPFWHFAHFKKVPPFQTLFDCKCFFNFSSESYESQHILYSKVSFSHSRSCSVSSSSSFSSYLNPSNHLQLQLNHNVLEILHADHHPTADQDFQNYLHSLKFLENAFWVKKVKKRWLVYSI